MHQRVDMQETPPHNVYAMKYRQLLKLIFVSDFTVTCRCQRVVVPRQPPSPAVYCSSDILSPTTISSSAIQFTVCRSVLHIQRESKNKTQNDRYIFHHTLKMMLRYPVNT